MTISDTRTTENDSKNVYVGFNASKVFEVSTMNVSDIGPTILVVASYATFKYTH